MNTYGLIGFPLGHSFSKEYFTKKFKTENRTDYRYVNFPFQDLEKGVLQLKNESSLRGLNITIPYKEKIVAFLNEASEVCSKIKSCNCIRIEQGKWYGYNTDVIGFRKSLIPLLKPHHNKALVFGSGGASKAILFVLKELGIDFNVVSRTKIPGGYMYSDLTNEVLSTHTLLVNTTPVGLAPNKEDCLPMTYEAISDRHLVYDLIYNPEETMLLRKARLQGAATKNGYEMLLIQAEESWKIWQGL